MSNTDVRHDERCNGTATRKGRAACERTLIFDIRPGNKHRDRILDLVAELSDCSGGSCCKIKSSICCLVFFVLAGISLYSFTEHQIELNLAATHSELNAQIDRTKANSELDDSRARLRDLSGMVLQELTEALAIKHAFEDEATLTGDSQQLDLRQTGAQQIVFVERALDDQHETFLQSERLCVICFHSQKQRLLEKGREVWHDFGVAISAWYAPLHNQRALSFPRKGCRRLLQDHTTTSNTALGLRSLGGRVMPILQWATCALMVYALIGYMMPGAQREMGPRNHAHVGDAGPPYVGTATLKVPPAWSVERSQTYSLRSWISDLILWSSATDLDAHRLGPIAALQVTGSAKELVRELTPEQLANGQQDPQTGQHITGLMILVRTLAQRYAPLEQETQTKAVSEFLAFARQAGESVDALLVRFDVLRNRAALRGGLGMNAAGLSWLLLRALNLPPDLLDRLLAPLGGQMPQNDAQLAELMQRIRRQGHLYEQGYRYSHRQGGVGDPGTYYFPVVPGASSVPGPRPSSAWDVPYSPADAAGPHAGVNQEPGLPSHATPNSNHDYSFAASAWHEACPTCGMYYGDDDDASSMTSSDDGGNDPEAIAFASVDVMGQVRGDDDAIASELYLQYRAARKKWRRFTGKVPRRYRKGKGKGYGSGTGGKNPYRSYASFLPAGAFAGGKGKGKTQGKGSRTNPRGRDGKVLRCSKCNSDQHLWRQCPLVTQASGTASHFAQPVFQPAIALHSSASAPPLVSETRDIPTEVRSLPGVTFSSHYVSANSQTGLSFRTGLEQELDALSQVSASSSRAKRTRQEVGETSEAQPPSWEPGHAPTIRPEDSISQASASGEDRRVTELVPGSHAPRYPPPPNSAPQLNQEQTRERSRATLQLQSLLYGTWWEATDGTRGPVEHSDACCFHQKTRVKGKVGLLIDPGAHDNLCRSLSMDLMSKQLKCKTTKRVLTKPLNVQGVGNGSQEAGTSQEVKFRVDCETTDGITGSFISPIVQNSELPPLLGLKSLRKCQAILDTAQQKLILPGPGGVQMTYSPGTLVLPLEMSESGHLILPLHPDIDSERNHDANGFRQCSRYDCRTR